MTQGGLPLAGVGVLVTRPTGQAASLMQRIRALGGAPLAFPTVEIQPLADDRPLQDLLGRLSAFSLAIFISPTAVEQGLAKVAAWPETLPVAAIGKGTADALAVAERGIGRILAPQGQADSEHLLALPELADMVGQRVVIFRGEGGRERLAETLAARGAQVEYAECYRRALPQVDPAPVLDALRAKAIQAVTALSSEALDNLFTLLGEAGHAALIDTPLFAPHPRIAAHARNLGMYAAIATPPGEQGLTAGLVEYFRHV